MTLDDAFDLVEREARRRYPEDSVEVAMLRLRAVTRMSPPARAAYELASLVRERAAGESAGEAAARLLDDPARRAQFWLSVEGDPPAGGAP